MSPPGHCPVCSVSVYKLHLKSPWGCLTTVRWSAPREHGISAAVASAPVRRESACRQFLGLLEFSCRLPPGTVPALGSANSVHSQEQWDSWCSQQDEQPDAQPAPVEKKRKCSHSGEFRAGSSLPNPCLRSPEGPLGLQTARGDAQEGRWSADSTRRAWAMMGRAAPSVSALAREVQEPLEEGGHLAAARGRPFWIAPHPPLPAL